MKFFPPEAGPCQHGFALVAAIFIVVVLAMLGIMMVTIGGMQRATVSAAAQGTRAYYAARSGIEWGVFQALAGGCAAAAAPSPGFLLTQPGLDGFSVVVSCASSQHRERNDTYNVYAITATATFGAFGNTDYVSRTLNTTVTSAQPP
jgi:MSHA biogenesis protein MshP